MRKLTPIEQRILDLANYKPIHNYKQFAEYSNISYISVRRYIPKLIKDNYLISTPNGIIFNKDSDYKPLFNNMLIYINALERELLERNLVTQEQLNQIRITLNIS